MTMSPVIFLVFKCYLLKTRIFCSLFLISLVFTTWNCLSMFHPVHGICQACFFFLFFKKLDKTRVAGTRLLYSPVVISLWIWSFVFRSPCRTWFLRMKVRKKHVFLSLRKVQTTCAGFLLSRYATVEDLKSLKWLPIKERLEWTIARLAHKSMYSEDCPVKLNQHVVGTYNLRSLTTLRLKLGSKYEIGTFRNHAAKAFNSLPSEIRNCRDYVQFSCKTRNYLAQGNNILHNLLFWAVVSFCCNSLEPPDKC